MIQMGAQFEPPRMGGLAEAGRQTEVAAQIGELAVAVESVNRAAALLIERLESVLRPENPSPGKEPTTPRVVLCPLADQLRNLTEGIEQTARLIDSNRDRLEI
jgi:hypothetical protein